MQGIFKHFIRPSVRGDSVGTQCCDAQGKHFHAVDQVRVTSTDMGLAPGTLAAGLASRLRSERGREPASPQSVSDDLFVFLMRKQLQ